MTSARVSDPRNRRRRAERILDVAGELLLRWGHPRVTIDEIARHADIGKGTVYLHWRTRDELFRAVFEREALAAVDDLLDALRQDPQAWLPHELARRYFLSLTTRPLLRGLFLGDAEMLGRLARRSGDGHEMRHQLVSRVYFDLLAEHGVLHRDLSAEAITYGFLATLEGFVRAEATADQQPGPDLQERSELLAFTIQRAFESGKRVSPAASKTITTRIIGLLTDMAEADRAERDTAAEPRRSDGDRELERS